MTIENFIVQLYILIFGRAMANTACNFDTDSSFKPNKYRSREYA